MKFLAVGLEIMLVEWEYIGEEIVAEKSLDCIESEVRMELRRTDKAELATKFEQIISLIDNKVHNICHGDWFLILFLPLRIRHCFTLALLSFLFHACFLLLLVF